MVRPYLTCSALTSALTGGSESCTDLEKRQHAFRAGALMPTQVYESKLAKVERPQELPPDTVGAFPGKYKDL